MERLPLAFEIWRWLILLALSCSLSVSLSLSLSLSFCVSFLVLSLFLSLQLLRPKSTGTGSWMASSSEHLLAKLRRGRVWQSEIPCEAPPLPHMYDPEKACAFFCLRFTPRPEHLTLPTGPCTCRKSKCGEGSQAFRQIPRRLASVDLTHVQSRALTFFYCVALGKRWHFSSLAGVVGSGCCLFALSHGQTWGTWSG